jgi:flagellar M-ring protein FliF
MEPVEPGGYDWEVLLKQYGRSLVNGLLIVLVFLFIVRPVVKELKKPPGIGQGTPAQLTTADENALPGSEAQQALPEPKETSLKDRAIHQARQDVEKTSDVVRGWINE